MRERAVRIGKPTPLTAIITEPEQFDASKPALVILNSGVMHHVGTCRMSVRIARAAAERGFLAVRFDFSGIGDSESRRGAKPFDETAKEETAEVMDYLERKRGVGRFVLYGLCSGADGSYEVTRSDERVMGMVQIDAFCYRTPKWYLYHYGPRLFQVSVWQRFFGRLLGRKRPMTAAEEAGNDEEFVEMPSYIRDFPPREEVAAGLQQIVDRDVGIYSIFTGGQMQVLNHTGQFEDSFTDVNFRGQLTVDYQFDATHIITGKEHQEQIPQKIADWLEQRSKDAPPPAVSGAA